MMGFCATSDEKKFYELCKTMKKELKLNEEVYN